MNEHIFIALVLDNDHAYHAEVLENDGEKIFSVTRMDKIIPIKICMEFDEELSLEENLDCLYKGLVQWEKINNLAGEEYGEKNFS